MWRKHANICRLLLHFIMVTDLVLYGPGAVRDYDRVRLSTVTSKIYVSGWATSLPFLRCFGASLSNLEIRYDTIGPVESGYIDRYVNEFCANTLASITMSNKHDYSADRFRDPFNNVTDIFLDGGRLDNGLTNWFPNFRCLKLVDVTINGGGLVNFPQLERLDLSSEIGVTTDDNAIQMLRANPQLQSFEIMLLGLLFFDFSRIMNGNVAAISILRFDAMFLQVVNTTALNRLVSQHPMLIELKLYDCQLELDGVRFVLKRTHIIKSAMISSFVNQTRNNSTF